ncbi:MAG: tetraacyldisaccharide 4'-kinase, partial [Aquificaceae bacterium]
MPEILNPYLWAIGFRNWAYDNGLISQCRFSLPVISVGNLSLGGSGKSSLVRHIATLLRDFRVCIISRGYRRRTKGTLLVSEWGRVLAGWEDAGDESYMLARLLPEVSVLVDEDRCRGTRYALERLKPELIILDDGFQHRKIHRDLNILLLRKRDFSDRLLPFGRLREPLKSMKRADVIVLSYAELEDFDWKHPEKPTLKMRRGGWKVVRSSDGSVLEDFRNLSFVAFSGLG